MILSICTVFIIAKPLKSPHMNDEPFKNSALTTILTVSNLENSKHFYLEVLGGELFREYGGTSAVISFLNNWLLLVTPGGETPDKPGTTFEPPTDQSTIAHAFTIRVENCQNSYEILKSRGAKFITPPYDWGQEERCFFRDPDGHLFEISEYKA